MSGLEPDREQLKTFVEVLFKHAGTEGYVSLRALPDDGVKPFRITPVALKRGLETVIETAIADASLAANAVKGVVFCPPIAVFSNRKRAREQDLLRALALSVECDKHPQTAREKLERLLGPATVVVESGGEWVDTSTGEVQAKLHLHWLLAKPVTDKAGFADLKNARDIATRLAGGDPSNVPMVHPIRWPGSVHRKGEPKLCTIAALNANRKIDLDAALNTLRKAAPAAKEKANGSDKNKNWAEQYGGTRGGNELGRGDRGGSLWRELPQRAGAAGVHDDHRRHAPGGSGQRAARLDEGLVRTTRSTLEGPLRRYPPRCFIGGGEVRTAAGARTGAVDGKIREADDAGEIDPARRLVGAGDCTGAAEQCCSRERSKSSHSSKGD